MMIILIYMYMFIYYTFDMSTLRNHKVETKWLRYL